MKKIEKLTKEQEELFPVYRNKWIAIGVSTEETDIDKAEAAIDEVYKCIGKTPPKNKIWGKDPYEGIVLAAQLSKYGRISAEDKLDKNDLSSQLYNAGYGNHDAFWLSFYNYFQEVCGIDLPQINGLIELSKHCGWWWGFEDTVVLTPKHNYIQFDDEGRLHNETGPALTYPSGYSLYYWHGISVPKDLIEQPETYTAERILNEDNVEVRRCMIEKVGMGVFLNSSQLVCKDDRGTLYKMKMPDDENEDCYFVHVINSSPEPDGTFKSAFLRVPPTITTPQEGIAWTFEKEPEEYNPLKET